MYKRQRGEIAAKFRSFDESGSDGITVGTLFHTAKQYGYEPPRKTQYHATQPVRSSYEPVSYTHLRAHETVLDLVCRLLLEKKKGKLIQHNIMVSHDIMIKGVIRFEMGPRRIR